VEGIVLLGWVRIRIRSLGLSSIKYSGPLRTCRPITPIQAIEGALLSMAEGLYGYDMEQLFGRGRRLGVREQAVKASISPPRWDFCCSVSTLNHQSGDYYSNHSASEVSMYSRF